MNLLLTKHLDLKAALCRARPFFSSYEIRVQVEFKSLRVVLVETGFRLERLGWEVRGLLRAVCCPCSISDYALGEAKARHAPKP